MKTVAIIQARLNSSRFPGKVLADLCGKPVLRHVVDQVGIATEVDRIVVTTPDEVINGHCNDWGVLCSLWEALDENDVLQRVRLTAETAGADIVVRVCGDNPSIWPQGIDAVVRAVRDDTRHKRDYDYAGYRFDDETPAITRPTGYFAEAATLRALQNADNRLLPIGELQTDDREHVTQFIYNRPGDYALRWLRVPQWLDGKPNVSIDTPEDLERVAEILGGKADGKTA